MPSNQPPEAQKHPSVTEHPEQRRQEETGHEDASDPAEVGRPPSKSTNQKNPGHAAWTHCDGRPDRATRHSQFSRIR
jgi:hypothetical protein